MIVPAFVDTNVVVYALGVDTDRRETAIKLLAEGVLVSAQVINETVSVLLGKQKFSREDAYEVAQSLLDLCEVLPVDTETLRAAMHLATHYSEDMQHGQVFDRQLVVINPFFSG